MKKVLAIALGMLLIPFTAFGMQTMSIDEMAEITGQSGVAIALDDVKVFFYTENEETWYQSSSYYTAASNDTYDYTGALGLIRTDFGQMLYLNAMLASDAVQGAAGNFTSIGGATEPNMKRNYMFRWTNPTAGGNNDYMGLSEYYGFNFGNKNPTGAAANMDQLFDSKALTIRAVNRAEVLSLGAYYRLNTLRSFGALAAPGYAAFNTSTLGAPNVAIAAVTIGLPTAEIHYKRASGETLEVWLSIAANPLERAGFHHLLPTESDSWRFGTIYYGAWTGANAPVGQQEGSLNTRTILILDGFIEIAPMEAYANPNYLP